MFDPRRTLGEEATAALNEAITQAGIVPHVNASGLVRLQASAGGAVGAIGRITAIALRSQLDGSGATLRTCAQPDCRWVFFVGSRSRPADVCGAAACRRPRRRRLLRRRRARVQPSPGV